jgi:hypothetical protein
MSLELKPVLREKLHPCPAEQGRTYFLGVGTEILDGSRPVQPEQAIVEPHFAGVRMVKLRAVDEAIDFSTLCDA